MRRAATFAFAIIVVGFARLAHADDEVAAAKREIATTVSQLSAGAFHIREDLRITRRAGTKLQIACVDDALSRADVATRRARETGEETLTLYSRGDVEGARAALRRLGELKELGRLASIASGRCTAAQRIIAPTTTTVTMTH